MKKINYSIIIIIILLLSVSCKMQTTNEVEGGYWQTKPKLALVLEDTYINDHFHYEETKTEDGKVVIKKIASSNYKMDIMKDEIVVYRETSDGKVTINVLDETNSIGFIDKKIFDEKFSTEVSEMIKFGDTAFVKNGTKVYDEEYNIIRTVECFESESLILGKIIERGEDYYKISYNPDGSWKVLIKKNDLKYDGFVNFVTDRFFTL